MSRLLSALPCALLLSLALACKTPASAGAETPLSPQGKLEEGRAHLASGHLDHAIRALGEAARLAPEDPEPLLLLAEASHAMGDDGGAAVSLQQADRLAASGAPEVRRRLAGLYLRVGREPEALAAYGPLLEAGLLTPAERRSVARLQAKAERVDAAFRTLEGLLRERPEDLETKVLEAEVLLIAGRELLGARLMDSLLERHPDLTSARLLRARYFLQSGHPAFAEQDLLQIRGPAAGTEAVVTLRAEVLTALGRTQDAELLLVDLLATKPNSVEALAQLAETKLVLGQFREAQQLVGRVLALRPTLPRAIYLRARALEAQGDLRRATDEYGYALRADPAFVPALSRVWRLQRDAGRSVEAVAALERLVALNGATVDEKVALAEMYLERRTRLDRAQRLLEEAIRRQPKNRRYQELRRTLLRVSAARNTAAPRGR